MNRIVDDLVKRQILDEKLKYKQQVKRKLVETILNKVVHHIDKSYGIFIDIDNILLYFVLCDFH